MVLSLMFEQKGGENTLIWEFMTEIRGNGRGSFPTSSSVHNQRIEWLLRDLWNAVCFTFYYMFQAMEEIQKPKHGKGDS